MTPSLSKQVEALVEALNKITHATYNGWTVEECEDEASEALANKTELLERVRKAEEDTAFVRMLMSTYDKIMQEVRTLIEPEQQP